MKTFLLILLALFGLSGCFGNDISQLSKSECIKKGYTFKVQKRFNYREGVYQLESRCYNPSSL